MNRAERRAGLFIPRGVRQLLLAWYAAPVAFALLALAAAAFA